MPSQDSKYALLPVYLVLDTSYSLQDGDKFNTALSFLPKLLSAMTESSSLSDKIRVEVITFDEEARVELSLGGLNKFEEWIVRNKKNPIVPDGRCTYYGMAFEKLKSEIQVGVRQIQSETVVSESYKAFTQLTDQNFEYRPNMICVGVGDANYDDLIAYGAGRYNSPNGSYVVGNEKLVIVPRDGTLLSQALGAIVPAVVASIVQSFGNASNMGDSSGVLDLFGPQEDIFEDIDWGDDE